MQEYQVTVNGVRFDLERPLFVLATQNPIEQEGTYSLPEAQLDRFMFNVVIEYPSAEEERRILTATTGLADPKIAVVATGEEIERLHSVVRAGAGGRERHRLRDAAGARDAADRTGVGRRRPSSCARGCAGAPARAPGRRCCSAPRRWRCSKAGASSSVEDVRAVALPVLRHRILVNFQAEADGIDADQIVARLLDAVRP